MTTSARPTDTMQAIVGNDFGKPASQHISIAQVKTPVVADPDDVLIKVIAASLNPVDYKIVQGHINSLVTFEKPYRVGYDVSGIVVATGGGVTRVKTGDAIYARVAHNKMGTLSTYTLTHQSTVALKPKTLSFDEAAAVPLAGLTAFQGLRDVGHMKPNDKVLILGGTGGVGTFAIQIAKNVLGASQIITTCGAEGITLAQSLGATQTVVYGKENFADIVKNMDFCLDTIGEASSAFNSLRKGGKVVSITATPTLAGFDFGGVDLSVAGKAMIAAGSATILANAALHGVTYDWFWMRPSGAELTELADWIDQKKIRPVIDRTYSFTQYKEAFDYIEAGHAKGKVVIHIQDEK